jgi:hypothetical protein
VGKQESPIQWVDQPAALVHQLRLLFDSGAVLLTNDRLSRMGGLDNRLGRCLTLEVGSSDQVS